MVHGVLDGVVTEDRDQSFNGFLTAGHGESLFDLDPQLLPLIFSHGGERFGGIHNQVMEVKTRCLQGDGVLLHAGEIHQFIYQIYEGIFLDCSYGFRPGRSCHDVVREINHTVMTKKVNYVLEADIKGFFD